MACIYIPVRGQDTGLEVPVDQLSGLDPKTLIDMLVRERVPLEIWLRIAVEYRKIGREDAFETIIQLATGAKQRRGFQNVSQSSSSEGRGHQSRVMSNEEEQRYMAEWLRNRGSSDYDSSVSISMLFDAMSAHLLTQVNKLMSAGEDMGGVRGSILSEAARERRKRDLLNETTWYLQQADVVEKQRYAGQSTQWYHHLMVGWQYFCKKEDSKALSEFKLSLSLFESRTARLGLALVLIRTMKYVEALEELSKVYTSIYASFHEPLVAQHVDGLQSVSSRHLRDYENPTSDFDFLKANSSDLKRTAERTAALELLTTHGCLRPLMALVWAKIGNAQRAIEVLKLQVHSVEEGIRQGLISSPPVNHDRTLSMLGVLLINKHNETMAHAQSIKEAEEAAAALREAYSTFSAAYQINHDNPNVLNHLSNLFFTQREHEKRDWEKIDAFAQRAKELAQAAGFKEICAESCYYLGRSAHSRGRYVTARQHYMEALVFSHNFPLPRYALAQIAYHENDSSTAIDQLTKLDAKVPDLADTKAFLGKIYLKLTLNPSSASEYQSHYTNASKLLSRAIQLDPTQMSAHLDLAQLKERTAPVESLSSYLLAADLSFQRFIAQSSVGPDSYKSTAAEMLAALNDESGALNSKHSLYPGFLKRLNLLAPRIVYNNVSVMRMTNGLVSEAKDSLLRTLLMGACTLHATDAAVIAAAKSTQVSTQYTFVNPTTYVNHAGTALEPSLVFTAIFGASLRDLLPSAALERLESFILTSGALTLPLNLTTAFNLGLCYEKLKQFHNANTVYQAILNAYPHYHDAKMRMAIVKRESGDVAGAEVILKEIMASKDETSSADASSSDAAVKARVAQQQQYHANARSMAGLALANILLNKKDLKEAQTMLDGLMNALNASAGKSNNPAMQDAQFWTFGSDTYSLVQYANFFLNTSYSSPNREKNLKWAVGLFNQVLKQAPGNIYAANGLAIINALHAKDEIAQMESEKSEEASGSGGAGGKAEMSKSGISQKSVTKWTEKSRNAMNAFLAIRESCPNLPDILINLGHLSFAVGDYRGASKHYQTAWKQLGGASSAIVKQGQVAPMLARCLYELGHFDQAKQIMESVLPSAATASSSSMDVDETPSSSHDDKEEDLWFNLAVMCKEWAMQVLNRVDNSLAHVKPSKSTNGTQSEALDANHTDANATNGDSMEIDDPVSQAASSALSNPSNATSSAPELRFIAAPSEEEQRKAIDLLHFAKPIFDRLSRLNSDPNAKVKKISFSTKKCSQYAKLCETNAELAVEKLETYREELAKEQAIRDERKRKVEEEEARAQQALLEEEERLKKELEEQNAIAEALRLKSQQMMEDFVSSGGDTGESKRATSSSRRKRTKSSYDADSDEEDANERIARNARRKTRGRPASDDEEEEFDPESSAAAPAPSQPDDAAKASDPAEQEDHRRSQLEEIAKRRNLAKRGRDEISPADSASHGAAAEQVPSQTAEGSSANPSGEEPVPKKRKLKDNREKSADDDLDDVELPDDL
jgi:tetratricopeptide (TPR) repeat protein